MLHLTEPSIFICKKAVSTMVYLSEPPAPSSVTWAVLPVRPLGEKGQIDSTLALDMYRHSLNLLTNSALLSGVLVVSRDSQVLSMARERGAHTIQQSGSPDLDSTLLRASHVVKVLGAESILVLPADVPFASQEDIAAMLHLGRYNLSAVITPDHELNGTNAFLLRPPTYATLTLGVGSFRRNLQTARQAGLTVRIYRSPRLRFDVDKPTHTEKRVNTRKDTSNDPNHRP
jgi:2-phospho-L-lactate/phosphoenolpyruvate guanylyltransferase